VDLSGQTFAADAQNPQNGLASPVAGTDDDPLYSVDAEAQTLHYTFSVPNGKYTLKLFFFDQDSTAAGQRTFNLTANGAELLKHFDIFAAAGAARTALVKSSTITISNKTLALVFKGILGSAIVSAIELIPN
jgi:beta-galactosidase